MSTGHVAYHYGYTATSCFVAVLPVEVLQARGGIAETGTRHW